ncbi:B-cell receptor-associated protein 31-like [Pieris napi]|uniref:B-cell receptor-associated protein 31-like n=1 Tax=Pieris napi TaxID=78633 RepID=UPI001FB8B887|nr:B-cell receptor-associated protein 31-like [Pieris napi]
MSIQWSFIAGYLYFEIAIVTVLILPIFSPRKWHTFFRSRLFSMFQQQAAVYFYVLLGVLALFLMDAVREMRKYSHTTDHVHLTNEMKGNVKLFRAQRNFYITGFTIFLAFVIRRLVTMIIIQHELELKAQEIIIKAEDTVQMAKSTLIEHRIEDASDIAVLTHKFTLTKALLDEQKLRVQELEEEATMWRLKYEEMQGHKNGQGDE